MFARVTRYKMKQDKIDAAKKLLETLKPQIMAMPGMKQFLNVMDADGNGYVISILESEAVAVANQATVNKIWSSFSDMLAEPVAPSGYSVLVNEIN